MSNFLPHDGSYFDDLAADDERTRIREANRDPRKLADPNSISMVKEINQRPGATIYVATPKDQIEMFKVLELWRSRGNINVVPKVFVDAGLESRNVSVRMV